MTEHTENILTDLLGNGQRHECNDHALNLQYANDSVAWLPYALSEGAVEAV